MKKHAKRPNKTMNRMSAPLCLSSSRGFLGCAPVDAALFQALNGDLLRWTAIWFMRFVILCAFALAALMLAGCSHPAGSMASTTSDTTRLNQAEVVRIAVEAAAKHGYRLSDYKDPQVHYEFTRKDKTWSVFYDGKVPLPGHHFLVWVDDQTGAARMMPGE
jgi:hypothetical protein